MFHNFQHIISCYSQTTGNISSDTVKSLVTKELVKNSLNSRQWAIQFGTGSDFTLTNFDDAILAVKYHFSSKSALRLDLNMNYCNRQNKEYDYTKSQEQAYVGNLSFFYY